METEGIVWIGDPACDPIDADPILHDEPIIASIEMTAPDEVCIHATRDGDRNALVTIALTPEAWTALVAQGEREAAR